MKKQNLKSLTLNKKLVSNVTKLELTGGGYSAATQCASYCYACGQVPTKQSRCCNQ